MQKRLVLLTLSAAVIAGCQTDPVTSARDTSSGAALNTASIASNDSPATLNASLAELRRAVAPYHNVDKAIADGYVIDANCVSHPTLGAMGHHAPGPFRNDGRINLLEPDVLLYEMQPNGKYRLNGVEFFELKSTWDAAHGGSTAPPPILFGANVPLSNHPPFGPHYELHVWIFKHNPSGLFASWNPTVSCP